jgi:hypothetical protein
MGGRERAAQGGVRTADDEGGQQTRAGRGRGPRALTVRWMSLSGTSTRCDRRPSRAWTGGVDERRGQCGEQALWMLHGCGRRACPAVLVDLESPHRHEQSSQAPMTGVAGDWRRRCRGAAANRRTALVDGGDRRIASGREGRVAHVSHLFDCRGCLAPPGQRASPLPKDLSRPSFPAFSHVSPFPLNCSLPRDDPARRVAVPAHVRLRSASRCFQVE